MELSEIKPVIEALLFVAEDPLTARKMADVLKDVDTKTVRQAVDELREEYDASGRGFEIQEVAGGYQVFSRQDHAAFIAQLRHSSRRSKLSQAALETLAIVAYKQPVTRADIEAIRGVGADALVRTLTEKELVKVVGRAEVIGRPLLYGTTRHFLQHFGLKSLNELPKAEGLKPPSDKGEEKGEVRAEDLGMAGPAQPPAQDDGAADAVAPADESATEPEPVPEKHGPLEPHQPEPAVAVEDVPAEDALDEAAPDDAAPPQS